MLLGIDIGGTKCAVVSGNEQGRIIDKISFATTDVRETVNRICDEAEKMKTDDTVACGISCGGPLDEKTGIILSPPNLPGWDNIKITEILEKRLNIPCRVRNDANACAIAEFLYGAGKGTENMVFMTFGTGLGAGIILNGRLYSGTNGFAGEIGHIRLERFGPVGYGKSGSFEGFCSGGGIEQLARTVAAEARCGGVELPWAATYKVKDVADAARSGEPYAQKVFDICATELGEGLSAVIDILNPEKIIIGSVFARCRDLLEKPMNEVIRREALRQAASVCEITVPGLGEAIGDTAAIAVAAEAAGIG